MGYSGHSPFTPPTPARLLDNQALPTRLARLLRWGAYGYSLGGVLLVIMYGLGIVFGLQSGRMIEPGDLLASPLVLASSLSFISGLLILGLALGLTGLALRSHTPKLAISALIFAGSALLCSLINLALVLGRNQPIGELGGLTVVSNLMASFLLGSAGLRSKALGRGVSITLLVVGLITFPCILLTIPLEAVLPTYVIADLPFPVWGAVFVLVGAMLARRPQAERG